jgi:competence protein ComEA
MPTPSEQKALTFVAMIVLLGGTVRVVRAGSSPGPSAIEQQALARQATAVDSAAATSRARPRGGRTSRARKASADSARGGPTSAAGSAGPSAAPQGLGGFPPAGPRIDVDYRTNRQLSVSEVIRFGGMADATREVVDLDRAFEREIDLLPRVGPALARRLVANRDSFGSFGSLEALGRVKGFGPATRKRLAPLVTFSGRPSSRP